MQRNTFLIPFPIKKKTQRRENKMDGDKSWKPFFFFYITLKDNNNVDTSHKTRDTSHAALPNCHLFHVPDMDGCGLHHAPHSDSEVHRERASPGLSEQNSDSVLYPLLDCTGSPRVSK